MALREGLLEQLTCLEYSSLIGRIFGSGKGVGAKVRLWERVNFNERQFDEMELNDFRKGIVLLMRIREQRLLALIDDTPDKS